MNLVWRKARGDARAHARRFALIALVLFAAAATATAMWSARQVLVREIAVSFSRAQVPDIAIWPEIMDDGDRARLAAQQEVAAVEARRIFFARFKAADGTWLPARVRVQQEFAAQSLGMVHLHGAPWPDDQTAVLIEQSGDVLVGASARELQLRQPDGTVVSVPIAARVHDPAVAPSTQERMLYVYVRPEGARRMGHRAEFDHWEIRLKVRGSYASVAAARDRLSSVLATAGSKVLRSEVLSAQHPHAALMNAMLSVLTVLAALAALTGTALCAQLTANWAQGERRSIGILKTLGAGTVNVFLRGGILFVPLLLTAVLAGYAAGLSLGSLLIDFENAHLNIDITSRSLDARHHAIALAVPLGVPALALAWPLFAAARLTPRAAMSDVNVQALPWLSRLASRLFRFRDRLALAYALRNSWRRPGRLALMLTGIAAGAALVMTTTSNFESLMSAVDKGSRAQAHDLEVQLLEALPAEQAVAIAHEARGVATAEAWMRARLSLADPLLPSSSVEDDDRMRVILTGMPNRTALFALPAAQGRGLDPASVDEVLVTRRLADQFPSFRVGAIVGLRFRGRETPLRVVGMVEELATAALYANAGTFEAVTGLSNLAHVVRIRSSETELDTVANALDAAFLKQRIAPAQVTTRNVLREALEEHFRVVGDVIRLAGMGAALLGALLLCSTLAVNLIERRREIGVLRTLGAKPARIFLLFLAEGLSIAVTGTLVGALAAIPLTLLMTGAAESRLLFVTVTPTASINGLIMLGIGLLLTCLSIMLVLRAGLRRSVTDVLRSE